ncbi:hypothetical protein [Streptomyces sp. NPDC001348]
MRKFQRVAVVAAMLGSVGFLGAGVSQAGDDDATIKLNNKQSQECSADGTYVTGSETGSGTFLPANVDGAQKSDASKSRSVTCTQLFTVGH